MLSRGCTYAQALTHRQLGLGQYATERRVISVCHGCCEQLDCECACHEGTMAMEARPGDPLSWIRGAPGSKPVEEAAWHPV